MTSPTGRGLTSWLYEAYAPIVELRVLGPVEVTVDGRPVPLGGPKQRHVLALLAAEAGVAVSVDRLIDGVWGEDAPPAARGAVQTYVSNLRGSLGEVIVWESEGYRLSVNRDAVDALRFVDLVAGAKKETDPARAASQLRTALGLWRGRPFADVEDVGTLHLKIRQLEELRVAALEWRVEADLANGLHVDLVGELEALAAEHPFRERFRALHMLALYRCGRQAEALRAYDKTRSLLADELGIDPSPMLQEIEQRILDQDAGLLLEPQVENQAFLFTDLEDSTLLWELHPEPMVLATQIHDEILRDAVASSGGRIFKISDYGICAVFATASLALGASEQAQQGLAAANWKETGALRVRMAIDSGDVETKGEDFFGPPLNRCARLLATGHGGQVLISADAHQALIDNSNAKWQVKALGEHRLKGLGRPQPIFQQVIDGVPSEFPPLRIDRPPPLLPGVALGRVVRGYELREQIGGGDFGLVYKAYQPSVGREVAVKVVRPEYVNQPAFVRRFEAEAQLVAHLEHPHVVSLYDYWRDPDGAYLVMRWMRGGSLRQALNRGPWNLEPASALLRQICGALSYAHRRGVVHRDLKPGNVLLDEDGNGYLSDFGIATRIADPSEARRPISSSPAYVAPEELEGRPLSNLSDIYSLGLLTFELLTGQRPPLDGPLPALQEVQPKLPSRVDEVIDRATADNPSDRFQTVDEYEAALSSAMGLGHDRLASGPSLTPTRNPYKGLVAFKETDASDFYGREQVTSDLLRMVAERGLVAVVGPSGIGKSSVIKAGLVPALRSGGLPGSREWVITDMFPGAYPYEELEAALLRVAVDRPEGFFDDLARDERGFLRAVKRILSADTDLVLIIDQFEELFTLTTDEQLRRQFLEALIVLLDDSRGRTRVIIGLRADFFDRPLRYPRFGDLLSTGVFPLVAPSSKEMAEAIARPAHTVGVQLEDGLVDEVVSDIADQPGALPLLQYALTELFAARTSDTLTVHGYRRAGGVAGAIPRKAEELLAQLDLHEQAAARQVFLRLVAVHEAAADTRRRVRTSELRGMGIESTALERILGQFGAHRLLTFDRDPVTRGSTVEVAHEAMLSEWGRLRNWIDERREDLLLHRRLTDATQEWEQSEREPSYLLTGGRLDHFESWARQTDLLLTDAELAYIDESRQAESERLTKRKRRRWSILGGFAGAAIVATVLAVLAFLNQQRAEATARNATISNLTSQASLALDQDPERSLLLGLRAADISRLAGEAVASEVVGLLQTATQAARIEARLPDGNLYLDSSPNGSLLATDSIEPGVVVIWELETMRKSLSLLPAGDTVNGIAFSPAGNLVAVAYTSSDPAEHPAVVIWDSATGARVHTLSGLEAAYRSPSFSPSGRTIAATHSWGDSEEGVTVWDLSTGASHSFRIEGGAYEVRFDELGQTLMVTEPLAQRVGLYDSDSGQLKEALETPGFAPWFESYHGTKELLALADSDQRSIQVWRLNDRRLLYIIEDANFPIRWSPDGDLLAISGLHDGVQLVDSSSGEAGLRVGNAQGRVYGVAFDSSGRRLASVAFAGETVVTDITPDGPQVLGGVTVQTGAPYALYFSPDGREIAVSTWDGTFERIDLETGSILATLTGETGWNAGPFGPIADPLLSLVASISADGVPTIRSAVSLQSVSELPRCSTPLAFSVDGSKLVVDGRFACTTSGGAAPFVPPRDVDLHTRVIEVESGTVLLDLGLVRAHEAIFQPSYADGRILVIATSDAIEIHDVLEREKLVSIPRLAVDFASDPDGRYLGWTHPTGVVGIVDVEALLGGASVDAAIVFEREVHPGGVSNLAVGRGGVLATASPNEQWVRVWEIASGNLLVEFAREYEGDRHPVLAFDPSGRFLMYTSTGGVVRRFPLSSDELLQLAENRLTRGLTADECLQYFGSAECG